MKIKDYQGPKGLTKFVTTIQAGEVTNTKQPCSGFYIEDTTGDLTITAQGRMERSYQAQTGENFDADSELPENLQLNNKTGSPITFTLWFGFGEFLDKRKEVTVSGTVDVDIVNTPVPIYDTPSQSTTNQTATDGSKNVTTAGTPVALGAAYQFETLYIKAKTANTGLIKFGFTGGAGLQLWELIATEWMEFKSPQGKRLDLAACFIDSTVNGEGVVFITQK